MLTLYHKHLTLIVSQTFEKGHKDKKMEIRLHNRPLNEIIELNHRIEANGIYMTDIML